MPGKKADTRPQQHECKMQRQAQARVVGEAWLVVPRPHWSFDTCRWQRSQQRTCPAGLQQLSSSSSHLLSKPLLHG